MAAMAPEVDRPSPPKFQAFNDSLSEDISFPTLAYAYRAARVLTGPEQAAFSAALPGLTRKFHDGAGSGQVHFCEYIAGGCALTSTKDPKASRKAGKKYRIHTATGTATIKTAPILALLAQCERMCIDANEFLREPERGNQARQIFSVATYLLGMLDELGGEDPPSADDLTVSLKLQQEELARIQNDFIIFAQREAQMKYFQGMVAGLAVILLLALVIRLALARTEALSITHASVVGVFSAGALGALVSVMQRMTSDKLTLRFRARSGYLRLLGGFRPLIGAVMATALFVFIRAGTLDVFKTPGDDAKRFYFFLAIGFLAGFSERWAQDMLAIPLQSGQLGSASTEQPAAIAAAPAVATSVLVTTGSAASNGSATGGGAASALDASPAPEETPSTEGSDPEGASDVDAPIDRGASDDSSHV